MWAMESWGALTLALGLSLSCARPTSSERSGGEPQRDDSTAPTQVIATLRTRDSQLTVTSAGGAVRYSLVDAQGITKTLTLEELQAHDPNLYEVVRSAAARSSGANQ